MKKKVLFLALSLFILSASWVYAGKTKIKPYGFILVNANFNEAIEADIPVKVALNDTKSNFLITPRQTRLGFNFSYSAEWEITGKVELDFWGLKGSAPSGGVTQSAPRLRLAYFQIAKDNLTFLFGQQWLLFAPLNPNSLAHVSIPQFSSCGNLWNRMPQIRFEYRSRIDQKNILLLQVALLRPLGADVTPAQIQEDQLGAGEFSGLPFVQGRISINLGKTATIGISTHLGVEDFKKVWDDTLLLEDKTHTIALAGDVEVKANIFSFAGEAFLGENLRMLFSNAYLHSDDDVRTGKYRMKGVQVKGGWGQTSIGSYNSKIQFNAGAGLEVLNEKEVESLIKGEPILNPDQKEQLYRNITFFGNMMLKPMDKITLALEYNYIKTTYKVYEPVFDGVGEEDASNNSVNLAFKFDF